MTMRISSAGRHDMRIVNFYALAEKTGHLSALLTGGGKKEERGLRGADCGAI